MNKRPALRAAAVLLVGLGFGPVDVTAAQAGILRAILAVKSINSGSVP